MVSNTPMIIGITGPSCAGKTALANLLADKIGIGDVAVISLDSYYRDLSHLEMAERERQNFDLPESLEHELLISHLNELVGGGEIHKPVWQFDTHTRAESAELVNPAKFIFVEGIFAFHWDEVRELFGLKIFVELDEKVCLSRRLERDMSERGSSREYVLNQFEADVKPMHKKFVLPARSLADIVVSGNDSLDKSARAVILALEGRLKPESF